MSVKAQAGLVLVGALVIAGCASTTFNSTWKAPDAQPLSFKAGDKVVAMVMSPNKATRLGAEQVLANELTKRGLEGMTAHSMIPEDEAKDKDKAKARVEAVGAVGVVVMRATGKEKEISSSPSMYTGAYYGGFWGGYYGMGWGMAYDPGYLRTDTLVYVETLVYDLRQDKLVWAAQTKTMNPSKVESFISELVAKAASEMRKEGVIR